MARVLMVVGAVAIVLWVASNPAVLQDGLKLLKDAATGLGSFFKSL
jgi:hypothetical protein